jgi:hypothetical protein
MWTEKLFSLARRETRASCSFDDAVAAIEDREPGVPLETNSPLFGRDSTDTISAGRLDGAELRRRVEARLGSSGFVLLMKIEHDLLMGDPEQKYRREQNATGSPSIVKDVSDDAPKVSLYTPLGLAALGDEKVGSARAPCDDTESLTGSFSSAAAQKIGSSLNQKLITPVEGAFG